MRFYVYQKNTLLKKIILAGVVLLLIFLLIGILDGKESTKVIEEDLGKISSEVSVTFGDELGSLPVLAEPIYQGSEEHPKVSLTFNVFWGEEYIEDLLKILKDNDVKATFYLGGTWVEKFPDLAKKIGGQNHEIASHGYSHPHVDNLSVEENLEEIQKAEEIIYEATSKKPVLYAPPYGERGENVLKAAEEAGYKTILWSLDTIDWQLPSKEAILKRVTDKVKNGSIILMHPTAPTVEALPLMINELKKDYELVTVSELLKDNRS